MNRVDQRGRLNEVAFKQHKKLIDDQEEMSKKLCTSLEDMVPKLMSRDQDVNKEFAAMEKRLNCHRVALDRVEDWIQALEDAMALQQAKMDSMLDKLCHCQTRLVQSHSSSLHRSEANGVASRMRKWKDPLCLKARVCPMRRLP